MEDVAEKRRRPAGPLSPAREFPNCTLSDLELPYSWPCMRTVFGLVPFSFLPFFNFFFATGYPSITELCSLPPASCVSSLLPVPSSDEGSPEKRMSALMLYPSLIENLQARGANRNRRIFSSQKVLAV